MRSASYTTATGRSTATDLGTTHALVLTSHLLQSDHIFLLASISRLQHHQQQPANTMTFFSSTPTAEIDQLSAAEFTHPTLARRTILVLEHSRQTP